MPTEANSSGMRMEEGAEQESRIMGQHEGPGQAVAHELLVTPVSKLPENDWKVSYSNRAVTSGLSQ